MKMLSPTAFPVVKDTVLAFALMAAHVSKPSSNLL
jgi:hypothetical protein